MLLNDILRLFLLASTVVQDKVAEDCVRSRGNLTKESIAFDSELIIMRDVQGLERIRALVHSWCRCHIDLLGFLTRLLNSLLLCLLWLLLRLRLWLLKLCTCLNCLLFHSWGGVFYWLNHFLSCFSSNTFTFFNY